MAKDDAENDSSYNHEIIALLQQVGQRLISHEQDRRELRSVMDDLLERTDQSERAYLTIQDRINKSESLIEKRQKQLEKINNEQMERVEKAIALSEKIEEALAQHNRMSRRLDKVVQDKARMIRKLDRIEETVLETQDSINAKAMALLAEHESGKAGLPQAMKEESSLDEDRPWWQQHGPVRAAAVAAMVLLGVCGGWAINAVQSGGGINMAFLSPPGVQQTASVDLYEDETEPPSFTALNDYQEQEQAANSSLPGHDERPGTGDDRFVRAVEEALHDEPEEVPEPVQAEKPVATGETEKAAGETEIPQKAAEEPAAKESPLEMNDEQLLASLNEDPDALAARLNEISPAAAANMIDEIHGAAPETAIRATPAAFTPGGNAKEMTTGEFLAAQTDPRPLRDRIPPDPNLPGVIKEVEKKAYDGVPEAQHDIAAIYTAGHGGVETDYERAAMWFKESALQGVTNARYNLGVLYHQGLGVKEDINLAVKWYRAAAEGGHPEAQYNLGIAYIEGIGTRYNPEKAAYFFEESAKQGILEAAYNLGLIHENGLTGDSRPDEALYWYKQAADMGSPEAKVAMDQLAKTLGLFPEEVERLYSQREEDEKAEMRKPAEKSRQTAGAAAQTGEQGGANSGVEYIEAQPLYPDSTGDEEPVLADIEGQADPAPKADHAVVAQLQEQLIRIGLYPGPADGVYDSLTEDAIRAYQTHYNLSRDGRPSQALLVHMMTSELGSSSEYGSRAE